MAVALCTDSVMKRRKGKLMMSQCDFENSGSIKACLFTNNTTTGRVHICTEGYDAENYQNEGFKRLLSTFDNLTYISQNIKKSKTLALVPPFQDCPGLVFSYRYFHIQETHMVHYRPALLNGRHIVDVVRAICGPADVCEAELDRARKVATEGAMEAFMLEGVWWTSWRGTIVTTHA